MMPPMKWEQIPRISGKEVRGLSEISGPLLVMKGMGDVAYGEMVEVVDTQQRRRLGRVLQVTSDVAVVEVFEGTGSLKIKDTRVRFLGRPFEFGLSEAWLGRILNGFGRPIDGLPQPPGVLWRNVNGKPINPMQRDYPREFIQTGISAIDGMNSLVRGQKLPIFSGSGLPHTELAAQIVQQARLIDERESFAVVFAGMGVKHDVAEVFRDAFEASGNRQRVVMILNLADEPPLVRVLTPRIALTIAEFLAFDLGMHVLVVLTDMTAYCEALREVASAKGEIPTRKGYPGYLYSDLASLYERAGRIEGLPGSITQIPLLTMPNDDITHPIPDLTGYITEGQIVLDRNLFRKGIRPPINVLPSLSRLMKDGIGEGHTRPDHSNLANQLYSAYARVRQLESLSMIIGEEELSNVDKQYLKFGERFERELIAQGSHENRSISETLEKGWQVLSALPREELTRVTEQEVAEFLQ